MGFEACGRDVSRDSSVSIVTKVRAGRSGFRIPEGLRGLSLMRNAQTGCEVHKASYSIGTGGFSSVGQVACDMRFTTSPLSICHIRRIADAPADV